MQKALRVLDYLRLMAPQEPSPLSSTLSRAGVAISKHTNIVAFPKCKHVIQKEANFMRLHILCACLFSQCSQRPRQRMCHQIASEVVEEFGLQNAAPKLRSAFHIFCSCACWSAASALRCLSCTLLTQCDIQFKCLARMLHATLWQHPKHFTRNVWTQCLAHPKL